MADWDAADLVARCNREAGITAQSTFPDDDDWYAWLTEAQEHWYGQFSIHFPVLHMGAPTLITSSDGGYTYYFPNDDDGDPIHPLAVQLFQSQSGRPLHPGTFWSDADYVWEGDHIRFPRGNAKSFSDGPYARFITPPGTIGAADEPTLKPKRARKLMVYRACALWATRGGKRDPRAFYTLEAVFWSGRPDSGDLGLLGELKMQNPMQGMESVAVQSGGVLSYVDTGKGYTPAS
jgi:hypothetical protein